MQKKIVSWSLLLFCFSSTHAFAKKITTPPACLDNNGNAIAVDDAQVIEWKSTTANEFEARAHVSGELTKVYANETGHNHFEINLDSTNTSDTLEVIYNISFGALPTLKAGMIVEACGDYITSDKSDSEGPASPDGAIIHWIHKSDSLAEHPNGFLIINGVLYGQGNGSGN